MYLQILFKRLAKNDNYSFTQKSNKYFDQDYNNYDACVIYDLM